MANETSGTGSFVKADKAYIRKREGRLEVFSLSQFPINGLKQL
jgi:hypothetical protein